MATSRPFIQLVGYFFIILFCTGTAWAVDVPLTLFPIENYNQQTETWFPATDSHYYTAVLSPSQQTSYFKKFLKNYTAAWDCA